MQRPQAAFGPGRSPQGFAVDGDHSPFHRRAGGTHPVFKALLQRQRRERFKYPPDRVVARNPVAQPQIAPQPPLPLSAPILDVVPAFRSRHHRAQRQHHNIQKIMVRSPFDPRIRQVRKPLDQSGHSSFFHRSPQRAKVDPNSAAFTTLRHKPLFVNHFSCSGPAATRRFP